MQYYLLIANLAHKVYVTDSKIHVSIEVGVRALHMAPDPEGVLQTL